MLNQLVCSFKIVFAHHCRRRVDVAAGYGDHRNFYPGPGQLNLAGICAPAVLRRTCTLIPFSAARAKSSWTSSGFGITERSITEMAGPPLGQWPVYGRPSPAHRRLWSLQNQGQIRFHLVGGHAGTPQAHFFLNGKGGNQGKETSSCSRRMSRAQPTRSSRALAFTLFSPSSSYSVVK